MPHVVTLYGGDDGRVILASKYHDQLVQAIKDIIPHWHREWDGKVWHVHPEWGDAIAQAVRDLGMILHDNRPVATPALPPPTVSPELHAACERLCITPNAPMELAHYAFKLLAKTHHPDVGGDIAVFQDLNHALTVFKSFNEVPF
jgi:hypothetical protein